LAAETFLGLWPYVEKRGGAVNYVSVVCGLIAIAYGVGAIAQQLRPANRDRVLAIKREGNTAALSTHIANAVAATVTPIVSGVTFIVLGLMGRSLFPFSLFGR
jgi:hypothetical protein